MSKIYKITSAGSVTNIIDDNAFVALGISTNHIVDGCVYLGNAIYGMAFPALPVTDTEEDPKHIVLWKATVAGVLSSFSTDKLLNVSHLSGSSYLLYHANGNYTYIARSRLDTDGTNLYISISQGSTHHGRLCKVTMGGVVTEYYDCSTFQDICCIDVDSSGNVYMVYTTNVTGLTAYLAKITSAGVLTNLATFTDYDYDSGGADSPLDSVGWARKVIAITSKNIVVCTRTKVYNVYYKEAEATWKTRTLFNTTTDCVDTGAYIHNMCISSSTSKLLIFIVSSDSDSTAMICRIYDYSTVDNMMNDVADEYIPITSSLSEIVTDSEQTPTHGNVVCWTSDTLRFAVLLSKFIQTGETDDVNTYNFYTASYWNQKAELAKSDLSVQADTKGLIVSNYFDFDNNNTKRIKRVYLKTESKYATGGYFSLEPDRRYQDAMHVEGESDAPTGAYQSNIFSNVGIRDYETDGYFDSTLDTVTTSRIDLGTVAQLFRYSIEAGNLTSANKNSLIIYPPEFEWNNKSLR